jgi:hypothetical protein
LCRSQSLGFPTEAPSTQTFKVPRRPAKPGHEIGEQADTISGDYVEHAMSKGFKEAFDYMKANEDELEVDVISLVSMLNVRGYKLHRGGNGSFYGMPLSVGFESYLKSICDQFWQSFGAIGSPNFDASGKWNPL